MRAATGWSAALSSAATSVWAAAPVELEDGEGAGAEPVEEEDDDGSGVMGRLGMPANRRSAITHTHTHTHTQWAHEQKSDGGSAPPRRSETSRHGTWIAARR